MAVNNVRHCFLCNNLEWYYCCSNTGPIHTQNKSFYNRSLQETCEKEIMLFVYDCALTDDIFMMLLVFL